jgi:hypothetical protein
MKRRRLKKLQFWKLFFSPSQITTHGTIMLKCVLEKYSVTDSPRFNSRLEFVCLFFFCSSVPSIALYGCRGFSFYSFNHFTDGRTPWRVISSSKGLYLNTWQHKHRINTYTHQTSMPWLGFEPTIPASERANTVHPLDRSVIVTGVGVYK